jgi:Protein of unknown function C-terminus (DUF2399)
MIRRTPPYEKPPSRPERRMPPPSWRASPSRRSTSGCAASATKRRRPLSPWRFGAADYRRALAAGVEGPPLAGEPVAATWDPDLPAARAAGGVAVEEEAVLGDLLSDLGPEGED